jgi:ABC-type glutathione transport system ATPase component
MTGHAAYDAKHLLSVERMVKHYPRHGLFGALARRGEAAVDDVSMRVLAGEVVGLIGESGSGKTTLARAALGLLPYESGDVRIFGVEPRVFRAGAIPDLRHRAQLLLQNPDASLNPGLRIVDLLRESARLHQPHRAPTDVIEEIAASVGIAHRLSAWPHELSGGEKRRVGIARLLISDPILTVADEPTSGLDASLKADIADLLLARRGADRGYLIISHDLPLVVYACTRIVVLYAGRLVEEAPVQNLRSATHHPYTWSLLASAGVAVAPYDPKPLPAAGRGATGCPYHGPCPLGGPACARIRPQLRDHDRGNSDKDSNTRRAIACLALESETPCANPLE